MQAHIISWMRPIITVYFPMAAILNGQFECVLFLPIVHTCKHGPTSQFAYLLRPFLVGRAFFGSCWWRTPVRNNNRHNCIMINIKIVPLSCSIRVRTIVKEKGSSLMQEHTIMHEIPTFFHFRYHIIQSR